MTKNHPYHPVLEMVYAVLSLDWLLLKLVPYLLNYHQMKEKEAKYDQSHIYTDFQSNLLLLYSSQYKDIFLPADAKDEFS
ncbi:CRISPR-associated endonuclease Cas9 domain protein [Streptococcus sanguinis]|nr:CRISPR-associated endonuclease Cas9 domain protein [Streptococcus sanguinis]MCC3171529.1 CRISPR-associated endonuclease Cas9 domain protein [Streptococcus sanguinis]